MTGQVQTFVNQNKPLTNRKNSFMWLWNCFCSFLCFLWQLFFQYTSVSHRKICVETSRNVVKHYFSIMRKVHVASKTSWPQQEFVCKKSWCHLPFPRPFCFLRDKFRVCGMSSVLRNRKLKSAGKLKYLDSRIKLQFCFCQYHLGHQVTSHWEEGWFWKTSGLWKTNQISNNVKVFN